MKLSEREQSLGELAASVVEQAGGSVTFAQYDALMIDRLYFYPINWIAGWGLDRYLQKQNRDKLCAFAAVGMGLLRQNSCGYAIGGDGG